MARPDSDSAIGTSRAGVSIRLAQGVVTGPARNVCPPAALPLALANGQGTCDTERSSILMGHKPPISGSGVGRQPHRPGSHKAKVGGHGTSRFRSSRQLWVIWPRLVQASADGQMTRMAARPQEGSGLMTDEDRERPRKRRGDDSGMSQGDAISNPFELTTVACCVKIRTDSVEADGATCRGGELEESALVAVTVDLAVRPANPGEPVRAVRNGHEDLRVELRESLSGYLADRMVSAWQIGPDAGSLAQAADSANAAADGIRIVVQIPAEKAATAAGAPRCSAEVGAGVIATFVTEPVTRPITDLATLIEIAGVIIGFVANIHPLVMACANRLAKKEITDLVAKAIVEVMKSLASATNTTDGSAEGAAASQLSPHDPAGAELTAQEQRQLDALRKRGDIGPEVQEPMQIPNAKKILQAASDAAGTATGNGAAKIDTEELNATT